ncbi:CBS domain-containing protein [Maridesulfovibrio frigidus]|uniref:CBS domain-containing protein n=1 Tax=Maridesulfovibrio frigidus TaxID=340956 RepID=UPI0004E16B70|nr:CBS domain-containing protein [Maridesulfovibrio frigidus]
MNNLKVSDLMIPVVEYSRVKEDTSVHAAMMELVKESKDKNLSHPHRDLLVEGADGKVVGMVTMLDIFKHMEPSYLKLLSKNPSGFLDKSYVQKVFKDFNLWSEPFNSLCQRIGGIKVSDIMHTPEQADIVGEEDKLDKALHAYIVGAQQPLLVRKDDRITGVLRLGDVFEKVRDSILACEIATTDNFKE